MVAMLFPRTEVPRNPGYLYPWMAFVGVTKHRKAPVHGTSRARYIHRYDRGSIRRKGANDASKKDEV